MKYFHELNLDMILGLNINWAIFKFGRDHET